MLFDVQPSLPVPIYRQIVDQVRRKVAGGQLRPGEALPSVRRVAEELAINPMTVSKAYALLEAEGLLRRERGVAMTVAEVAGALALNAADARLALLKPALEAAARHARELEIPPDEALALFRRELEGGSEA